jgi:hypothetical protein
MLRNQLMAPPRGSGIAAVVAVAGLSIGIGASLGVSSATAGRTPHPAGPEPEAVIAVLGTSADGFPAGVDTDALIRGGIDRDTLQKLGSDGAQSYWTGLDNAGDICLITILDVRLTAAAACSAPEKVQENGLDLSAEGDNHQSDYSPIVAVLVPDSAEAGPIASPAEGSPQPARHAKKNPWKKHGSNLVVARQSDMPIGETFEFPRKRGHGGPPIRYTATAD